VANVKIKRRTIKFGKSKKAEFEYFTVYSTEVYRVKMAAHSTMNTVSFVSVQYLYEPYLA
jgi:hypothetical protein